MIVSVVISIITILCLILAVLFKPYIKVGKITVGLYWVVCLIGALLIVLCGGIPLSNVWQGISADTSVNPLKILALFLSMTMLSIFLGEAGFFDFIAEKVFLKAKGTKLRLFLILYAVVALLTIFTSNDIIILTFTPPICIFAKKAKISPLPFLFGEFVAANTFSLFLIVGNPTNIYLSTAYGITFFDYFCIMVLPALACGILSLLGTLLVFRKQLKGNLPDSYDCVLPDDTHVQIKKVPMIIALVHLIVCIILLALSDIIGIEMYLICVCLFLSLFIINLVIELITAKRVSTTLKTLLKAPFELIPFILSMFVIVLSLSYNGVTESIGSLIMTGEKSDGLVFGVLSTLGANLFNNIPMSVLFEKIIDGKSLYAVLGTIIGSNLGAIVTPLGALAGIMWNKILDGYGERLSFAKFFNYGILITLISLLSLFTLFLI